MSTQWYYLQDGHAIGPIDESDLRGLLATGALKSATPIRPAIAGESSWRPAITIDQFKTMFEAPIEFVSSDSNIPTQKETPRQTSNEPETVAGGGAPVVQVLTARSEGSGVAKWMWAFAIGAWLICFLPFPGISTFLVWLFASISGTLAFVALFKNRVGAGVAGMVSLAIVTPAMWFLSLAVYPMLLKRELQTQSTTPRQAPRSTPVLSSTRPRDMEIFDDIIRSSRTLDGKLAAIDYLIKEGFDLNGETTDGATPIRSLMDVGVPELVEPLMDRGLSIEWTKRNCRDQYWFAQGVAHRPKGLEVLAVLADAGFEEDCLKAKPNSRYSGFVCSVMLGSGTPTFDVTRAVRAVDQMARLGFDVSAKCLGKTLVQEIEDGGLERKARLAPIAEAVRRNSRG